MEDRHLFRGKSLDEIGNIKVGDWVQGAYSPHCTVGSPSRFKDEHGAFPAIYVSDLHDIDLYGDKPRTARISRWIRVDPATVGHFCIGCEHLCISCCDLYCNNCESDNYSKWIDDIVICDFEKGVSE